MNFLAWFGNLISDISGLISTWENPVIKGISWLEGLFGNVQKDAQNVSQIITIVDQNLAAISVAIVQEAGTIESLIESLKNINPADITGSLLAVQQDADKIYTVWIAQRTAIINAITAISNQITVIEKTGI